MQVHPDPVVSDQLWQKAEWRARLIESVLRRPFDDETLVEMLEAALHQAHSEGLMDAEGICREVSEKVKNSESKRVAGLLADAIRDLDVKNKALHNKGSQ